MRGRTQRLASLAAALVLLVTCTIAGLVLPAAAEAPTNLFVNGDFEGFGESTPVTTPWDRVTGNGSQVSIATVTEGVGVGGSWGLKMGSTVGTAYVSFDSAVPLEEGATYRLSWMATSGAVGSSVSVSLNSAPNTTLTNASVKKVAGKLSPTVGEWISYYIDFTAGAGAYVHDVGGIIISRDKADTADISFDNFALTKLDDTADVVLNGDFEEAADASLYAASLGGAYVLLSNESKAAVVQESADNRAMLLKKSDSGWTGGYFNDSHFVGGQSYKVTFDYKGGSFRLYANPAAHGSFNENKANVVSFAAADDWTSGEFVFNFLEGGSNNWAFSFEKNSGNNTADTYIDNFKIVKVTAPEATGITLDQAAATVNVDETVKLTASVQPAGAKLPTIAWTTSDAGIATVANGVVTGVAEGSATITATAEGLTPVTCEITVLEPTPATGIALDRTAATLEVGGKVTLAVSTQPENADRPTVTWTTSDATVAAVENGVVKAVAEGTATVTATAAGLTPVTCTVTVVSAKLLVNGGFEQDATDGWGGSAYVTAGVGKDGGYGLRIESTVNEGDASATPGVYYKGAFNELVEENTVYRLTFDYKHEGKGQPQFDVVYGGTDWVNYKDTDLAAGVDWTTVTIEFTAGMAANMNAHKGWEWQLRLVHHANEANYGTGVLYADNFKLEKVRAVAFADSLSIIPGAVELLPYGSQTLQVGVTPAGTSKGTVTWVSSDPSVVTVSDNGTVTAMTGSGTATVTVRNHLGKTAAATVVISEYANQFQNGDFEQGGTNWNDVPEIKAGIGRDGGYGLELRHTDGGSSSTNSRYYKKALQLEPATTYLFSVDYLATEGSSFRFWSYGFGLKNPVIEAGDGTQWKTATVIFTTPTDLKLNAGWDFCAVCDAEGKTPAVLDNLVLRKYSSGIKPESITLSLQDVLLVPGRTEAVTAYATPSDADLNGTRWTSSDENVATVEYGVVMGVGAGTATITATTENGKTASCTVTVSGAEALVKNGSFDIEGDTSWVAENGGAIADGEGRAESAAAKLTSGASLSQTVTGLKARTTYQLHVRYRSANGTASIKLMNGSSALLNQTTAAGNYWQTATYEFTTGWRAPSEVVLTLSTEAAGPIYLDNIVLAEKASLVDLEASSVVWSKGQQVTPGTEMTFAVTVTNRGRDRVEVGETFNVDICVDGEVIQTLSYYCIDNKQLAQNETVLIEGDIVWTAAEGEHVISARVNLDQTILEMNVENNTCQAYMRVSDTPLEVPQVAQNAGMTNLTFSDEFDSVDSIDTYATGKDGYKWYVNRQWSAGTITPQDYTVENGILTLHANEPTYNITLSTMDGKTGVGYSYRMGYLEVKLRIPKPTYDHTAEGATGGIPAVWSFPENKWLEIEGENTQWVEIDWLEYWGLDEAKWPKYPDGYYTVTLHDQIQGKEGAADRWYSNGNSYQNGLGDGEWHTMGWLWANDIVVTYLDGEEVMRLTYDLEGFTNVETRVQEGVLEPGAFSFMNYQYAVLYLGGAVDNPLEVDYVHVWQGGDGFVVMPEETEPEVIVDIAADKFWYNYCTDDWGDAIYEVTAENLHNILEGQKIWEALSDERRAEINAILEERGQLSYEELLAKALTPLRPEEQPPIQDDTTDKPEDPVAPEPEKQPVTGERSPALPWILGGVMLLCAVIVLLALKRKK